jgi:hypothetical protein
MSLKLLRTLVILLGLALAGPLLAFLWSRSQISIWSKLGLSALIVYVSAVIASLIGEHLSNFLKPKD